MRHCAFCLKAIEGQAIKLCGKCRKRAYCSRECQTSDWSTEGQGHKNWCRLNCGEEDIDWKVCPIVGKGLGIVAMRSLPVLYRIVVDGCCSKKDHPAVQDLMPVNGTYEEKFALNRVGISNNDLALFLRISRVNHDCKPNADHRYDETFKAVVLFAQREIAEGEEITINYQQSHDIAETMTASTARLALQNKWGIVCSEDCFCYDIEIQALIARSRDLDAKICTLALQGNSQLEQALEVVKELMRHHETLGTSFMNRERTLYDGYQISAKSKNLRLARDYIERVYAIASVTLSPESLKAKEIEQQMEEINIQCNYLF